MVVVGFLVIVKYRYNEVKRTNFKYITEIFKALIMKMEYTSDFFVGMSFMNPDDVLSQKQNGLRADF